MQDVFYLLYCLSRSSNAFFVVLEVGKQKSKIKVFVESSWLVDGCILAMHPQAPVHKVNLLIFFHKENIVFTIYRVNIHKVNNTGMERGPICMTFLRLFMPKDFSSNPNPHIGGQSFNL